jgi:translation initiation factor IF-2
MSKKRVHEIAKELKQHGIELDNKEVVTELTSLGYDVKSHSSSLEDDQATAAVQRILDKRKPKTAAPPVAAKGFVVRRKVGPPSGGAYGDGGQAGGDGYGGASARAYEPAAQDPGYEAQASYEEPAREPAEAPEAPAPQAASAQPPAPREEAPAAREPEPQPEAPAAAAPVAAAAPPAPERTEAPAAPPAEAPAAAAAAAPPAVVQSPVPAPESTSLPVQPSSAAPVTAPESPKAPSEPAAPAAAAAPRPGTAPLAAGQARPGGPTGPGAQPPARRPGVQATIISRPPPGYSRPVSGGPPGSRPGGSGPGGYQSRPGSGPSGGGRPGMGGAPTSRPGGPSSYPPRTGGPTPGGNPNARPGPPVYRTSSGALASAPVRPSGPGGVQAGPAGAQASGAGAAGAPGAAAGGPPADPRSLRPTATQAVVISRPLIQVRRVTPSSTAHRNIPMAPGAKALGEKREFKVVPDSLGRGRELVDVSKRKEGQRGVRKPNEKEGGVSKQELTDLVWGRVTIPIRGKKRKPTKKGAKTQITEMAEEKKVIRLVEGISVSDLGQRMGVKTSELIRKLMALGKMVTANAMVDKDTAEIVSADYGWKVEKVGFEVEDFLPEEEDRPEAMRPRPPVVTVMGHVDHGKTSLLDAIRAANVAAGEAGGITQHIGAYSVKTSRGDITFLDTPGHEAFTSMRARGANITDVVILVVAGDDGVMPQTIEAIKHAKAAEVPIVVAINKMDLAGANPDRVKKELANHELQAEDWGGDTIMVPVSARTKMGLDLLLENVALQAEVLELQADPSKPAVGAIVEAKLEKGRGPVATVLVQEGTLRVGDAIVTGTHYGRVRVMTTSRGESVKEVLPGYSAEVVGLSGVPTAGDTINVVENEKSAKQIADHRAMKERQVELSKTSRETLDQLLAKVKGPTTQSKELRVVIKADVQGSAEAVAQAINKLSTPKVKVEIVERGVGMVTESDVMRAAASKGLVLGFNVRPESGSEAAAKAQGVKIQTYSIIYELIDGVRSAMEDLLEPIRTEKKLGRAEVRMLVNVPKLGTIAGSAVTEGIIKRNALVRLYRENKQVYSGKVASLRRFKDDVKEVAQGFECGIGIDGYSELKEGDIIEAYEIEETRPSLS